MRLLLDEHLSARALATVLREKGHDVRAIAEEPALRGVDDEAVLALGADEGRIVVTLDVRDFAVLTRRWAGEGRPHAGCAIVVGVGQDEFGDLLRLLEGALEQRPDQHDWRDYTAFLARAE